MSPTRPGSRGAVTRDRLLAAALACFVERGYHGTTTALLAERCGIAEGTIYRHFGGKDALYAEVARAALARTAALLGEDPGARLPARDRMRTAARRLVREAESAPAAIRLALGPVDAARLDAPALKARDALHEAVAQLVAAGKQEGAIRAGSADLWAMVWMAVVGAACGRVARGEWPPDHPGVELAIEAAWEAIGRKDA